MRARNLLRDRRGSMTLWAGGLLLVAILIIGGVVDFVSLLTQQKEVQAAADHAALAAAQELVLASSPEERVQAVASSYVRANFAPEATASAQVIENGAAVMVTVTAPPRVFFPGPVGAGAGPVSAEAIAEVAGQDANICVIALEQQNDRAISLDSEAEISAPDCAIYSNSPRPSSISVLSDARMIANLICSAGGKEGSASNFSPQPILDCPSIGDPLAERARPSIGPCDHTKFKKKDFVGAVWPGVYCDGLYIDGDSRVTMKPGVYVISNGDFQVNGNSEITGEGVGVFLAGTSGRFEFTSNAKVSLSAPVTGPMAGMLFMEANTIAKDTKHRITSDHTERLVGTIYLPRGEFLIDANQDVADQSEFTVIVARKLDLKNSPKLVLNTDYHLTDVPLPDGVGNNTPKGSRLVK